MKSPAPGIPLIALLGGDSPAERQRFERGLRSELDNNNTLTPEQRAELERYLANPIGAAAKDMQQSHDDIRELLTVHRAGRPLGTLSPKARYIRKLVAKHPELTAKELYRKAGRKVRGTFETFRNHVGAARPK